MEAPRSEGRSGLGIQQDQRTTPPQQKDLCRVKGTSSSQQNSKRGTGRVGSCNPKTLSHEKRAAFPAGRGGENPHPPLSPLQHCRGFFHPSPKS